MNIRLIVIGSLKENYWKQACEEYLMRLRPYAHVEIIECPDFPSKEDASLAMEEQVKEKEAVKVLKLLKSSDYVIALDLNKKEYTSPEFASYLEKSLERGGASITFLIGGSLGLADSLKARSNDAISFGKMTFPHQLARVLLLEQLYRAFRIIHHEPYHK